MQVPQQFLSLPFLLSIDDRNGLITIISAALIVVYSLFLFVDKLIVVFITVTLSLRNICYGNSLLEGAWQ